MLVTIVISLIVVGMVCFCVPSIWNVFEKALYLSNATKKPFHKPKRSIAMQRNLFFLLPQLLMAAFSSLNLTVLDLYDGPLLNNPPLYQYLGITLFFFATSIIISFLYRYYYHRIITNSTLISAIQNIICFVLLTLLWIAMTFSCYRVLHLFAGLLLLNINLTLKHAFVFSLYINLGIVVISRFALTSKLFSQLGVGVVAFIIIALNLAYLT